MSVADQPGQDCRHPPVNDKQEPDDVPERKLAVLIRLLPTLRRLQARATAEAAPNSAVRARSQGCGDLIER